jgi:hypothetical protein
MLLDQFGNDAAACDEVDHGDGEVAVGVELGRDLGWVADQPFGELIGQGRNLVDDDKWVSDNGGLDRGGAAGYDAGSGVVEGLTSVRHEVKIRERRRGVAVDWLKPVSGLSSYPGCVKSGGNGEDEFVLLAEAGCSVEHGG